KESYKLLMDLNNLEKYGSEELKKAASRLKQIFKASILFVQMIRRGSSYSYGDSGMLSTLRSESTGSVTDRRGYSLLVTPTKFDTILIINVHSAVENINYALTITGTKNPKKRSAEEVSPDETVFSPDDASGTEDVDKESESPVEETTENPKTILSWRHVIDKIKFSNHSDHDWLANGYNISSGFREFQTKTVDRLKNNPMLSYATDVDEILQ
ncbi:28670_t:CDS:2, partial [Gigaspora margarita]